MKRIGLIGEDPNDTEAIQHLLLQNFNGKVQFKPLLRNIKGFQLDNASTNRRLKLELARKDFDIIVFIRDLDGLETETDKIRAKQDWFNKLNSVCGNKGMFLLNIFELEALILADIEVFNHQYKTKIPRAGNVMYISGPKEFLKGKTYLLKKCYHESHCPDIFKKIRYKTIQQNCKYFKDFTIQLEKKLKFKK